MLRLLRGLWPFVSWHCYAIEYYAAPPTLMAFDDPAQSALSLMAETLDREAEIAQVHVARIMARSEAEALAKMAARSRTAK